MYDITGQVLQLFIWLYYVMSPRGCLLWFIGDHFAILIQYGSFISLLMPELASFSIYLIKSSVGSLKWFMWKTFSFHWSHFHMDRELWLTRWTLVDPVNSGWPRNHQPGGPFETPYTTIKSLFFIVSLSNYLQCRQNCPLFNESHISWKTNISCINFEIL